MINDLTLSRHIMINDLTLSRHLTSNDAPQVSQSITDGLKALRGDGDSKDKERDSGRSSERDRGRGRDSRDTESESGDKYGKCRVLFRRNNRVNVTVPEH